MSPMHVDAAVDVEIAALVMRRWLSVLFLRDRLQIDHRHVAARGEVAVLVEHIGDAARHARGEIAAGLAEHDDDAAGHVFAAVIADALDHGDGAGIAHGETFAGDAAEIAPRRRSRRKARCCRR